MAKTTTWLEEFTGFLRETLIPDLRESGRDSTADDFETAAEVIEAKELEVEELIRERTAIVKAFEKVLDVIGPAELSAIEGNGIRPGVLVILHDLSHFLTVERATGARDVIAAIANSIGGES